MQIKQIWLIKCLNLHKYRPSAFKVWRKINLKKSITFFGTKQLLFSFKYTVVILLAWWVFLFYTMSFHLPLTLSVFQFKTNFTKKISRRSLTYIFVNSVLYFRQTFITFEYKYSQNHSTQDLYRQKHPDY